MTDAADIFDTILRYVFYLGLGFGALFLVLLLLGTVEMPYRRKEKRGGDRATRGHSENDAHERQDRSRML